jgi:stearoyl-CoA desaturase (delta-9 desaturase)
MFGDRPYNQKIQPRENYWVSYGAFGEGYHNYHHTFPWDYSTSELGGKLNLTKRFIDTCAAFGLAYNLKQASKNIVESNKIKAKKALMDKETRLSS